MTKNKVSKSLEHNNFQFLDNKWYLYTTKTIDGNIITIIPTKSCHASGTNLSSCTEDSPCYTSNQKPFYCIPGNNAGQSALIVPKAGSQDGVLCADDEKTSNIPYVINVVPNGDTTSYECSKQTTTGTYKCDVNLGCIKDGTGTMTAAECLDTCQSGYMCNDDYTCSPCLMSDSLPECRHGNCSDRREFCIDCGKDNKCSGNGICIENSKCQCNDGYFGVHCEKKNCLLVPSGTCNPLDGKDTCNKSVPGCTYSAVIHPGSRRSPVPTCACVPDYTPQTIEIRSTECACKLPDNSPLRGDKTLGKKYWHNNKRHGGTHSDWDAICRQNYGPGAYSPDCTGKWKHDCYHDCGTHNECGKSMWYASSVPCVAPAGSIQNIPWAFYQEE